MSGWITFLSVIFTYAFVEDGIPNHEMNKLDLHFLGFTKSIKSSYQRHFHRNTSTTTEPVTRNALQKVALMFSDQQLVTGIAVLVVGFVKHCTITQYHFFAVSLLAWMSFTTHQSTVMILQRYLIENPAMRLWRVTWMVSLFVLVVAAQVINLHDDFLIS